MLYICCFTVWWIAWVSVYFLPYPAPPIVISTTASTAIIHKLLGTSATLGFAIESASPAVQISGIVWYLEKDDGIVQTLACNSTGHHYFSSDLLSLTIHPLEEGDEGWYTLTASNEAGSGNSSIYLNIGSEYWLQSMSSFCTRGTHLFTFWENTTEAHCFGH